MPAIAATHALSTLKFQGPCLENYLLPRCQAAGICTTVSDIHSKKIQEPSMGAISHLLSRFHQTPAHHPPPAGLLVSTMCSCFHQTHLSTTHCWHGYWSPRCGHVSTRHPSTTHHQQGCWTPRCGHVSTRHSSTTHCRQGCWTPRERVNDSMNWCQKFPFGALRAFSW